MPGSRNTMPSFPSIARCLRPRYSRRRVRPPRGRWSWTRPPPKPTYIRAHYEWDWATAEREFRRALELSPSFSEAHFSYSRFLAAAGRLDEALLEIARADELDPLSNPLKVNHALLRYFQGKYDAALEELLAAQKVDPKLPLVYWGIGLCHEQKGAGEPAIAALTTATTLSESLNSKAALGHAYAVFGKGKEARAVLAAAGAGARELRALLPLCADPRRSRADGPGSRVAGASLPGAFDGARLHPTRPATGAAPGGAPLREAPEEAGAAGPEGADGEPMRRRRRRRRRASGSLALMDPVW